MTSWIRVAAILGALAVALGAFGAHALRDRVTPADLEIWRTASMYHLIHSVALLSAALSAKVSRTTMALWLVGILTFGGTLYAMVLTGQRWLGAITPIGGACLIAGWVSLALLKPQSPDDARG